MKKEKPECFLIMPISDPDGYDDGHFKAVRDQILAPACEMAGFDPIRGDDVPETNLIHLDILKRLLDAPMAICDLSSHNPNVLFELGIRQAFDRPVVLVQELGTKKIFDIAPLRILDYRRALKYIDVPEDQEKIAEALKATWNADENSGVNSIVKLLSLTNPAKLPEHSADEAGPMLEIVRAEVGDLRSEIRAMAGQLLSTMDTERGSKDLPTHLAYRLATKIDDARKLLEDDELGAARALVDNVDEVLRRLPGNENYYPHRRTLTNGVREVQRLIEQKEELRLSRRDSEAPGGK